MRVPILTYQPMVINGNAYAENHLRAFAADLDTVTEAGFRILPLREVIQAWLEGRGESLQDAVAFCVEDGTDFDAEDLDHPTAGRQRSVLHALQDFAARRPGTKAHATSFVIASPEARAALDRACMLGQGWWSDRWWREAVASGLMHIANHSWDHHHEALPESFSLGARRGTFATIDTVERADHEIRQAALHLRAAVANPGTELFAYPYGEANDFLADDYLPRQSRELGLRAAFTDRPGFLEEQSDRWRVPRFMFGRDWKSPAELRALLERAKAKPARTGAPAAVAAPAWGGARKLDVLMHEPDLMRVFSGLATVGFDVSGGEPGKAPQYSLTLETADGRAYTRPVDLLQGPVSVKLHVNTHALPNGTAKLRATLSQGERKAWKGQCALQVRNEGPLAEKVRASLRDYGTPWVLDGPIDSTSFDIANPALAAWFDRPDAAARLAAKRREGRVSAEEEATLRQFIERGYAVLPVPLDDALLARLDRDLDDAIARKVDGYEYGTSQRVRNLHLRYGAVNELWRHPAVMRYLELIFEVPARACQTLTYVFGSQQGAHQDTIHLTPFPQGYMCGVWVALEDVKPDSGELEVYEGTHRLPRVYMNGSGCPKVLDDDWSRFDHTVAQRWRDLLQEARPTKVTYRPKRGTILIWHENLMHAGGVRLDTSLSRRSIVSHYFADGAIAFYDSTGAAGYME